VLATAAAGLGLLINQPIAHAVDRVRPYLAHPSHAHLLIARSHDPSFQATTRLARSRSRSGSGSTTASSAPSCWPWPRSASFARVYVVTHYPGDVVGGALIGAAAAAAIYLVPSARVRFEALAGRCGEAWDALVALPRRLGF
jgi:undecaprenyl-diphosphatase